MNNVVYSQVTSKPQNFAIIQNEPQIFIPVIPTEGLGAEKITKPTPQQLSYSVITAEKQYLDRVPNRPQGLIPATKKTREIIIPQVLLASVSY